MIYPSETIAGFRTDGIYCSLRMDERQYLLAIIGTTEEGRKERAAIDGGLQENSSFKPGY